VACDGYSQEADYDLYVKSLDAEAMLQLHVAESDRFEARPSLACDHKGESGSPLKKARKLGQGLRRAGTGQGQPTL